MSKPTAIGSCNELSYLPQRGQLKPDSTLPTLTFPMRISFFFSYPLTVPQEKPHSVIVACGGGGLFVGIKQGLEAVRLRPAAPGILPQDRPSRTMADTNEWVRATGRLGGCSCADGGN